VVERQKLWRTSSWTVTPEMMVPPGCRAPPFTPVHLADGTQTVTLAEDIMEGSLLCVTTGFGHPDTLVRDSSHVVKHTGRARDSMQALWSRLKEGGKQVPQMSWDLEEDRHSTSEVVVEDLPHSANLSPVLSISTPVTPYGPTPPSPLSDFVWRSPVLSSQLHTPYGPTPPSPFSDLVWSSPTSNEYTTSCLSSESTSSIREPQHMVALRARRKKAKAGNIFSLTRDVAHPSCEFMHCTCEVCLKFRKDVKTWQPGVCRSVARCKCPRCRQHYDSTGHWDPTRAASAQLYINMVGFNVLTCWCPVNRAHSIPPCVQQIKVINQSQWDLSHNLHGIDTVNNIMTVKLNRHLDNLHLYLLCNQCWHPLLSYIRWWLNTRRW